jgi:hypothetical protein
MSFDTAIQSFSRDFSNVGDTMVGFSIKHVHIADALKHIAKQISIKNVEKLASNVEHAFAEVAMFIPRGVFIEICRLNVAGMGGNLDKLIKQDPNKVKDFWKVFGGDFGQLEAACRIGHTKHPLLGPEYASIGVAPAAMLAAAAPIVAAAAKLIGELMPEQAAPTAMIAHTALTTAAAPGFNPKAGVEHLADKTGDQDSSNMIPIIIIGAAAIAAFFLLK